MAPVATATSHFFTIGPEFRMLDSEQTRYLLDGDPAQQNNQNDADG
jgi:hypothetical protein